MRRLVLFLLCCFLLTTAVFANDTVTHLQSNTTISENGTCRVSLTMELVIESESDLRFPLPEDARDITLNGASAETSRSNGMRWVNLSVAAHGPGRHTLHLQYTLTDRVEEQKNGTLLLRLPLLSGFSYPIEKMDFSITLPGKTQEKPSFTSTYYPETMDTRTEYYISGNTISGSFLYRLKDHETLTMTLPVSEELFPQPITKLWALDTVDLIRYGLTLLAAVYWLLLLRSSFPRRVRRIQPPTGITAGELGCGMVGRGVDFPMMVLSWAQMGYLSIQIDRVGRVLLRKRMDMGNERSEFEMRCFRTLFGNRHTVDAGSEHCARIGRKAGKTVLGARHYYRKITGNPYLFRLICAGIGGCAGISMANTLVADTSWRVVLGIALGGLALVVCWFIQSSGRGLHLRHRRDLMVSLAAGVFWLILSSWTDELSTGVYVVITQFLAGLACAFGGRRTELGYQVREDALGLRRYLKSMVPGEVQMILRTNPDYYFTMLPYAMALGVDGVFSRQFGSRKMPPCPYLSVGTDAPLTAKQWHQHLHRVVQVMDTRQSTKALKKLFGR